MSGPRPIPPPLVRTPPVEGEANSLRRAGQGSLVQRHPYLSWGAFGVSLLVGGDIFTTGFFTDEFSREGEEFRNQALLFGAGGALSIITCLVNCAVRGVFETEPLPERTRSRVIRALRAQTTFRNSRILRIAATAHAAAAA